MNLDLVVRGGVVVDGTGLGRRRADVGISRGRIVAVGHVPNPGSTTRVIDADGLIVAPGIIDLHTHYDPQLTFDPWATSSCYHGVTSVLAGNCGFSIAPTRKDDRPYIQAMFAKVEGMAPVALDGVEWDFESFPSYVASRNDRLGVNAACYVGHSSLRRFVMGPEACEREATQEEVASMRSLLRESMAAGAAGFSSSHSPTQVDGDDRPVPSRFSSLDELAQLVEETGRTGGGSISYLPKSVVGGLDKADEDLLISLGQLSRLPIIIQGVGGRDKIDAPGAAWPQAKAFLDRASHAGAAIYSLLRTQPFDRPIDLDAALPLYAGVPAWHALSTLTHEERRAKLSDSDYRAKMRDAVENPNRDPDAGSTVPPPHWDAVFVDEVRDPGNTQLVRRSIAEIAAEQGKTPADAMIDLALSEDLAMKFRWENKNPAWVEAVRESMKHPSMLMGVSDGGAHLDRDDSSDWSSYFLRNWVLDEQDWTLEDGVRQLTQVPAAVGGFQDRGVLLPGYAADLMLFDPETVGPDTKRVVHDLPGGEARFSARPQGIHATIVNGEPIVLNGKRTDALPGKWIRPSGVRS
jgi:N-acyl-D-aspartate/D-glutamate deacylase